LLVQARLRVHPPEFFHAGFQSFQISVSACCLIVAVCYDLNITSPELGPDLRTISLLDASRQHKLVSRVRLHSTIGLFVHHGIVQFVSSNVGRTSLAFYDWFLW
jgi:hypothetical protein